MLQRLLTFLQILVLPALAWVSLVALYRPWLGLFVVILHLGMAGSRMGELVHRFFPFRESGVRLVVGMVLSLTALGTMMGGLILTFGVTLQGVVGVILGNALLSEAGGWWARRMRRGEMVEAESDEQVVVAPKVFALQVVLVALYAIVTLYALVILGQSESGSQLFTPWQVLPPAFGYAMLVGTLVLGILIATRVSWKTALVLLVVHTFVMHGYLPFTHVFFYGADGWRHLATLSRVVSGESLLVVPLSESVSWFRVHAGEFAYAQFWGIIVLCAKVMHLELIGLIKWFVPVVWSLSVPLLLYVLGRAFGWSRRVALGFVWLSFLPFALQAGGSFSLPVNLSFVYWLVLTLLLVERLSRPQSGQRVVLGVLWFMSFFGHSVFVLVFAVMWMMAEFYLFFGTRRPQFEKYIVALGTIGIALSIPLVEWLTRYSFIDPARLSLGTVKRMALTFVGWYAAFPRSSDVSAGNIIFNQPPQHIFVPEFVNSGRPLITGFMLVFWLVALVGVVALYAHGSRRERWFASVGVGLFGSYSISRFWLSGENIFARRLDVILAVVAIFFVVVGGTTLVNRIKKTSWRLSVIALLIVSVATGVLTSFVLGPDTQTVSVGMHEAMSYVWQEEQASERTCVIAGVYDLLDLEAISHKEVVGGGFPIDQYFAQPELTAVYKGLTTDPQLEQIEQALTVTGAENCWLVLDASHPAGVSPLLSKSFKPVHEINGVRLWQFNRSLIH